MRNPPQFVMDSVALCACGHMRMHHVAGRYRCPVIDFDDADDMHPCTCPEFTPLAEEAS